MINQYTNSIIVEAVEGSQSSVFEIGHENFYQKCHVIFFLGTEFQNTWHFRDSRHCSENEILDLPEKLILFIVCILHIILDRALPLASFKNSVELIFRSIFRVPILVSNKVKIL